MQELRRQAIKLVRFLVPLLAGPRWLLFSLSRDRGARHARVDPQAGNRMEMLRVQTERVLVLASLEL